MDVVIIDIDGSFQEETVDQSHFLRFFDPKSPNAVCPDLEMMLNNRCLFELWISEDNPIVNNAKKVYANLDKLHKNW